MLRTTLESCRDRYRDDLLNDTLPFWTRHAPDHEHGGFQICLDRDGSVLDTDKGVWTQARFTWLLATMCQEVEEREEWRRLAQHGIRFLEQHAMRDDGGMWFQLTRDGRPLRKRRYVFTETFGAIAFAAWAKLSGEAAAAERARALLRFVIERGVTSAPREPKFEPGVRDTRGVGLPMILLKTAQIVRDATGDALAAEWVDRSIADIASFMKPEHEALLECMGADGEVLDHFDGRLLNPGHALEAAWFVLDEAARRGGDSELERMGCTILDWTWPRGWDAEYGGVLYFRDLDGKPVQEYWHDMKFWWPHNEAVLATLMAWRATRDPKYAQWHGMAHEWAHAHFPDEEHGEWYGYLHRDGRVSVPLKGNLWKGPFHVPRMQLVGWQVCDELLEQEPSA